MTSRFCRLTAMHEISVSSLCLPLGLFWSAALVAMVTGESFNINLGPAFILVLLVFLIPLVHLFVSTSRMRREAEDREQ